MKILRITYAHNLLAVIAAMPDGSEHEVRDFITETANFEVVCRNIAAAFGRTEKKLKEAAE